MSACHSLVSTVVLVEIRLDPISVCARMASVETAVR